MTPGQLARRQIPRLGEGPVLSTIAICVCALLAVALLGIGFSRPATRIVPFAGAYRQTGTFSYSAPVIAPTPVYPSGVVTTGQPIYPSLVNTVAMTFRYAFASSLPHTVHGTIEFRALLLSQTDTWQEVTTIHPTSKFTGDRTTITSQLGLTDLYNFIKSVSQQAGVTATTYSADLQPVVHLAGSVDGRRINETFEPVLPFAVTQNVITLAVAAAVAPPGATYAVPTASSQRASTLSPVQVGSIPHQVGNVVTVAKFQVRVSVARDLGIIFAALAVILLGLDEFFRRRSTRRSDEELLAAKMHVLVVPVASLGEPRQGATIDIDRFSYLARLAQFLERPILYQMTRGKRTYAVDDEIRQYRFQPAEDALLDDHRPGSAPAPDAGRSERPPSTRRNRPTWRSITAGGAAAVVLVALAATLITSFTASTNVPVSRAGTSVQLRLVSQLAPAGCGSLNLTRVVTGSGTFANSLANALAAGQPGVGHHHRHRWEQLHRPRRRSRQRDRGGFGHLHQRPLAERRCPLPGAEPVERRGSGPFERQLQQLRRTGAAVGHQQQGHHRHDHHHQGGVDPRGHGQRPGQQLSRGEPDPELRCRRGSDHLHLGVG